MPEELLPKPQTDLPLPEKEIPAHAEEKRNFHLPRNFLLGILFVVLLALIGGAYFLGRTSVLKELNPSNPTIPPPDEPYYQTPTPNPTENWQLFEGESIYDNSKKFSVMYPNSCVLKQPTKSNRIISCPEFGLEIIPEAGGHGAEKIFSSEEVVLGENNWLRTIFGEESIKGASYGLTADDKYLIEIVYAEYSNEAQSFAESIVSTFKFTGSNETFCGGFAGKACPTGYTCKLDGDYPDAGGTCVVK